MAEDGVLTELRTVNYRPGGFSLQVPESWRLMKGVPGAVITAVAPSAEGSFAATVTASIQAREPSTSDEAVIERHIDSLFGLATDALLVDSQPFSAAVTAHRVLVAYRQGVHDLSLEQWLFLAPDRTIVVSGACASSDYDRYADQLTRIAASLEVADA